MVTEKDPRRGSDHTSDALLFMTAGIWGFAFVAQRMGMEHVGPFTFNAIRFALGALTLTPLLFLKPSWAVVPPSWAKPRKPLKGKKASRRMMKASIWLGIFLFLGASFQQMGIVHTTAGKAGFITGLYVVFVPMIGILFGKRTGAGTVIGIILAATGLYFLSVTGGFNILWGDFLVLISALFWACHVLLIGWLSRRTELIRLAMVQYLICAALSMIVAVAIETTTIMGIQAALIPILYGGICSVGIAYTLQVIGQKKAHPAHAAIILSMEAVFAALGGWLILGEVLSTRGMLGAALMLSGILISQLWGMRFPSRKKKLASPNI